MSLLITGGRYRGRKLLSPPENTPVRPTPSIIRQAIFNILREDLSQKHFLDLFAGTGSVGFEALSRGAGALTAVENNSRVFSCLKKNSGFFEGAGIHLIREDALGFLKQCRRKNLVFDYAFIDPPFDLAYEPFLEQLSNIMAGESGVIVQFPWRREPIWQRPPDVRKKYGESGLAFFYN